jgi:hypothetical protein
MGTVIMMFILPIGIIVYFWDRRNYAENLETFSDFITKITQFDLSSVDKIKRIDEMFYQNGYICVDRTESTLLVEKKHFNIGVLFISVGLLTYFGVLLFIVYYRFIQKPRRLIVDLNQEKMLIQNKK